jgi:penicillin-binding protein 1C
MLGIRQVPLRLSKFSWIRRFTSLTLCSLLSLYLTFNLSAYFLSKPPLLNSGAGFSAVVYDRNGIPLDTKVASDGRYRIEIANEEIPEVCRHATLTYEDKFFFYHEGINPLSFGRSVFIIFFVKSA